MNSLKLEVVKQLNFEVGDKSYIVEFPLSAVQKAESEVGHTLRSAQQWVGMSAEDVPVVLRAGLLKNHPEVTEEEIKGICDCLSPEGLDEVLYGLCHLAFPKYMAELDKITAARLEGRKIPNAQGGAAN